MFVYIIECIDGSLYTGIAKDIEKRLDEHFYQKKQCAKYTKSHQMKTLCSLWQTQDKSSACKLEYHIKHLSKQEKQNLIINPESLETFFSSKLETQNYILATQELETLKSKYNSN